MYSQSVGFFGPWKKRELRCGKKSCLAVDVKRRHFEQEYLRTMGSSCQKNAVKTNLQMASDT